MEQERIPPKVIVLGTIHKLHHKISYYSMKVLKNLIKKINSDIICAELSQDQLDGIITCKSKPEYPEIIIPLASKEGYNIIPIQPNTPEGMAWGKERDLVIKRMKEELIENIRLECYYEFERIFQKIVVCENLKMLQSKRFDLLYEMAYEYCKKLLPSLWEVKEKWNMKFYEKISATIKENPRKKILITVGLAHKFWLNKKLSQRNDIFIEYIENYL
ncbi:MAG: hypothetical protein U9R23_07440 [Candidatus Cloacimonadota bacterium]|nr:hypothetical protein [Candidatus Cloacimonadota bacterium]